MRTDTHTVKPVSILVALLAFWMVSLAPVWAEDEQTLTAEDIQTAARNFLLRELDWNPSDVAVSVDYTGRTMTLPAGELDLEFKLTGTRHPVGHTPVSLVVRVDKELKRKIWLNANVEVFFDVVQATRTVPRDRILSPGDVEIVRVRSSHPLRNIIINAEEAIGKRAVRDIDLGQNLSPYMLKQVPLINRGDRVIILAEKGRIRITAPGLAREVGFKGAIIQVENLQTNKTIYGTVIDSKTIKVEF